MSYYKLWVYRNEQAKPVELYMKYKEDSLL